jgi:pimeloyl-ACP methyl ester carboxylesterase
VSGDRIKHRPPREFVGLSECAPGRHVDPTIDDGEDLTVLVHGCNSSAGKFSTLAEVFAFHGQRAICFSYDYRDSLRSSAQELRSALRNLESKRDVKKIAVIAHSQGGLVSRAALTRDLDRAPPRKVRELVTVSAPFSGIQASADCGKTALHVLSFGVTVGICQAIAGRKWTEIYPGAPFLESPRILAASVRSHHAIKTDERNTCLKKRDGRCREDDFVFGLEEQALGELERTYMSEEVIAAGHVEIVGEEGQAPVKLIESLQRRGVLKETPAERKGALSKLLRRIYSDPPSQYGSATLSRRWGG